MGCMKKYQIQTRKNGWDWGQMEFRLLLDQGKRVPINIFILIFYLWCLPYRSWRRRRIFRVSLLVGSQVIRPRERPPAYITFEGFVSSVPSHVSCELIGSAEAPLAETPRAPVGALASVDPHVRLQVRILGVHPLAVIHRTRVPSPGPNHSWRLR